MWNTRSLVECEEEWLDLEDGSLINIEEDEEEIEAYRLIEDTLLEAQRRYEEAGGGERVMDLASKELALLPLRAITHLVTVTTLYLEKNALTTLPPSMGTFFLLRNKRNTTQHNTTQSNTITRQHRSVDLSYEVASGGE